MTLMRALRAPSTRTMRELERCIMTRGPRLVLMMGARWGATNGEAWALWAKSALLGRRRLRRICCMGRREQHLPMGLARLRGW